MNLLRLALAFVAGAVLAFVVSHSFHLRCNLERHSEARVGRYQLQRGVLAWFGTKSEEQEICVDTVTGQSWFLTAFDSEGKHIRPQWEPIIWPAEKKDEKPSK
jgi:hypothetical protein